MIYSVLSENAPVGANWKSIRMLRSMSLRFAAALTLVVILLLDHSQGGSPIYLAVAGAYVLVGLISAARFALFPEQQPHALSAVTDALLVVAVLYQPIIATPANENHEITTSGLVVAFILLTHIGLTLNRRHILLFCAIVMASWLSMLAVMAWRHNTVQPGNFLFWFLNLDLALVISFGFTGLSVYLLVSDHERVRGEAAGIDQKRHNLSRFFSPLVLSDLQSATTALDLQRRSAAVMFVDLRNFTSYAENAPPTELATVLAEYRRIVAGAVFSYGGTIDKFIGDGVMAVFGQPKPLPDDADRSLACALHLTDVLQEWRSRRMRDQMAAFESTIGLHYGLIVGGVLESGFHDEFTVIGDAVNVAQRLERLAKSFDAALVVSKSLLSHARCSNPNGCSGNQSLCLDVVIQSTSPIDRALFLPADNIRVRPETVHRTSSSAPAFP